MSDIEALIAERDRMAGGTGNPRLDALRAAQAELKAQMDAEQAAHEQAQAAGYYRGALGAPESAPDALPAPGPTAGTPGPGAAAGGSQIAPWARDALDYLGETAANVPADAERVATGAWEGLKAAADDPLAALQNMGESVLGTMQTAARGPHADIDPAYDFRPASGADHFGRYDLHNIGESFRTTPVQTLLDLGGVAAVPFAGVPTAPLRATGFPIPKQAPRRPDDDPGRREGCDRCRRRGHGSRAARARHPAIHRKTADHGSLAPAGGRVL